MPAPADVTYRAQVALLLRCLPAVNDDDSFALKGGTALNLFLRDMPRLSVDIDLTYLPVGLYDDAVTHVRSSLERIATEIQRTIPNAQTQLAAPDAPKLFVRAGEASLKIEPNVVVRGSLLPPVHSDLCPAAQEAYETFLTVRRLDTAELYAGKLCAALDRQHPRDLFDVMLLQRGGGIPDRVRQAFVAYLAGHRRPMAELLAPRAQPLDSFEAQFSGMTSVPVDRGELEAARSRLFGWVATSLAENERRFLLSIKQDAPEWDLLPFEGLRLWPAIQWKLHNIRRMSKQSRAATTDRLREVLGL